MKYATHPGSGNSTCRVPKSTMLKLQNTVLTLGTAKEFMNCLYEMGEKTIYVKLSHRATTRQWGTAWGMQRRITLYRHTVWCFLHELAHILHTCDSNAKRNGYEKAHGRAFGKYQQLLHDVWVENGFTGEEITPDTAATDAKNFAKVYPNRAAHEAARASLRTMDHVWFYESKTSRKKIYCRVLRVNQKTCTLMQIDDNSRKWRVSPRLLNKYTPVKEAYAA